MRYVYTVWLTNAFLPNDDPDYEWPACFMIDGITDASAKEWGDHLARRYTATYGGDVIKSEIEAIEESALPGLETLPIVSEGHEASDEEIGW